MIAIYNPFRDGLKTYHDYNVETLKSTFRSIMVLKNRFGDCDVEVGCNFFGSCNLFKELPRPDEIYDYQKYLDPSYLLDNTTNNVDKIKNEKDENKNSNLSFIL